MNDGEEAHGAPAPPVATEMLAATGSLSTLTQSLGAVPSPTSLMPHSGSFDRLTKIEIENYRAFRGHFEIDLPDGCNLLVYGENGAGKSSLYHTLRVFLEAPQWTIIDPATGKPRVVQVEDHRHRFNTEPAAIRLTFGKVPYAWSSAQNAPWQDEVRKINQGKGFLDYKSLFEVHFVPKDEGRSIDLFDYLLNRLLPYYTFPFRGTNYTFRDAWRSLNSNAKKRWTRRNRQDVLRAELAVFNEAFEREVLRLGERASQFLVSFGTNFRTTFRYQRAELKFGPKRIEGARIMALPAFNKLEIGDYDQFFNEARLTALAICLSLAALKESPATGLRLLVLDDILIGLDMGNRMVILGLLEKHFRDWQIIIMTYHKAWYEVLKSRTLDGDWPYSWVSVGIKMRKAAGLEFPVLVASSGRLLEQARAYLLPGGIAMPDVKAAAVYARTAFEAVISWYCEEMRLPVTYAESRRELDTNDFLLSIENQLSTLRDPKDREFARAALKEIKHARRFVLNPNSHFNPESEDEIIAEIADGLRAVEDLELLLRLLRRNDFAEADERLETMAVGELVGQSLNHLAAGRKPAALDTLARAFELHVDSWFTARKEMFPFGIRVNRHSTYAHIGMQQLCSKVTWLRLKHAKPYLLGELPIDKLQVASFEAAARLLLSLRMFFLLGRKP